MEILVLYEMWKRKNNSDLVSLQEVVLIAVNE